MNFKRVDKSDFEDALLELSTLTLSDGQVRYPKYVETDDVGHLWSTSDYDLYVIRRDKLPNKGPFELSIYQGDELMGFMRGTKSNKIISFSLIHILPQFRRNGIGSDIYEQFLKRGYMIKSDSEITDATYGLYWTLSVWGMKTYIFEDGTVGLKK